MESLSLRAQGFLRVWGYRVWGLGFRVIGVGVSGLYRDIGFDV